MSEPWRDINDPGPFIRPDPELADNTRVARTDTITEGKKDPPPSEARLSNPKFLPPDSGLNFNDKCKVSVDVAYLRETRMTKITFRLFCIHNGKTEEMKPDKEGFEKDGVAEAEFRLFYPENYKDGDKAEFYFTASHRRGEKVVESGRLAVPRVKNHIFPMRTRPVESYKEEPRSFGSNRDNGTRKHAGCDLYAPIGTEILAVNDGIIAQGPSEFAGGTYALAVDHGGFIVRYAEIMEKFPEGIKAGAQVRQGQVIGYVGKFVGKDSTIRHMLHFEMYKTNAKGALTDKNNPPYMRRNDLENPTDFLDKAVLIDK